MKNLILILMIVFAMNTNAQLVIGESVNSTQLVLNRDSNVVVYTVDSNLIDKDGTPYFSYNVFKKDSSTLMIKFIEFENGWYCAREVFSVKGDYNFGTIWDYVSKDSIYDTETLRHYYIRGNKIKLYWRYLIKRDMYIIIYDYVY